MSGATKNMTEEGMFYNSNAGLHTDASVSNFTLKHGQSKTLTGLPEGVTYTVAEDKYDNYTASTTGNTTGKIVANSTAEVEFTNSYSKPSGGTGGSSVRQTGNLTVSNTVVGEGADTEKEFTFVIIIKDQSGNPLNGTYGDVKFTNGAATITLKHGESETFTNLPKGCTYTVTEGEHDGYTVTFTGDTGVIPANATAMAAFVNAIDVTGTSGRPSGTPSTPNTPDKPDTPGETDTPGESTIPSEPVSPDGSTVPVDETVIPDGSGTQDKSSTSGEPDNSPLDDTPKTSDPSHTTFWLMAMLVAGVTILMTITPDVIGFIRKRKK